MPADFEQATLMVDNCEPVLTETLRRIGEALAGGGDGPAAVQTYFTTSAPEDMRKSGDKEQALLLRESLKGADPAFWQEIGQHYMGQWTENQR